MEKTVKTIEDIRLGRLQVDIIDLVADSDKYGYLSEYSDLDQDTVNDRLMELVDDFLESIDKQIKRQTYSCNLSALMQIY